jgi:hypothetical protein
VVLDAPAVHWAAEQLGLTLPPALAPEPVWRSPDAAAARTAAARAELAGEGLLGHDGIAEDLEDSLRLLCRAPAEVSAYVQTDELTYRLHAAGGGRAGAFACYLPRDRRILLRPATPEAPGRVVARELPEHPPARSVSSSVPVAELRAAEPRGDAARVAAIFARPRNAGGQVCVGVRGRRGDPVTFVDTDHGRWLSHRLRDGRFVVAVSGTSAALLAKLGELTRVLHPGGW